MPEGQRASPTRLDPVDQLAQPHILAAADVGPADVGGEVLIAVARLGLRRMNMHALRHGWASTALRAGVHPRVVHERLGHSTIAVTLGTSSHGTPGLHSDAAEAVTALYGAASDGGQEAEGPVRQSSAAAFRRAAAA